MSVAGTALSAGARRFARVPAGAWTRTAALVLLGALLAGLVVYPTARLLFESVISPQGHLTLSSYQSLVTRPSLRVAAWHSLLIASLTTAGCVLLGVPMAWAVARSTMPLRGFVRTAASLTLASPSFLGALAWMLLLGPGAGKLNRLLIDLFHLDGPPFNIFSPAGIVLVQTLFLYPLVFLVLVAALETADPALEDSARVLGARRWRVVRTVSLPLATPAIFSGAILVFVESLVLFGPPAVLGMPVGYQTMPTQMFLALRDSPPRPDLAAAMALPVILIIGGLLAAQRRYTRRRQFTTISGKRESPRRVDTGRWGYVLAAFCLAAVIVSIVLPFGMLLMVSFQRSFGRPFGPDNLAPLQNFLFVFQQSAVRSAFAHSLVLAALASAACMALSVLAAWLVDRARVRAGGAVALSMLGPMAIPGPVLGVALLLAFAGAPWHLGGSLTILFLAYVVRGLPLAFAYARSGLQQIHPELEEACRTMGAHWHQALRTVVVPLSRGSWLAAGTLNFVLSFRELGASIFLYSGANVVTAVVLYDFSQEAQFTLMAAVSILVVLVNLGAVWFVRRWVREGVAA